MINTTSGPRRQSDLIRRDDEIDNEDEHTTTIEYCLAGCPGAAHKTGVPDAEGHFCHLHVHRSAHIVLKKAVLAEGFAAPLA
jgi:hypothetical protein